MVTIFKSKQSVILEPINREDCWDGDIAFCKVRGNVFMHLVKRKNNYRGLFIGNNHGHTNGWTKKYMTKSFRSLTTSHDVIIEDNNLHF